MGRPTGGVKLPYGGVPPRSRQSRETCKHVIIIAERKNHYRTLVQNYKKNSPSSGGGNFQLGLRGTPLEGKARFCVEAALEAVVGQTSCLAEEL